MDLKHSTDMTASAETVIHGSKSTDFIKPKGSSTNLEAQNPGTASNLRFINSHLGVLIAIRSYFFFHDSNR